MVLVKLVTSWCQVLMCLCSMSTLVVPMKSPTPALLYGRMHFLSVDRILEQGLATSDPWARSGLCNLRALLMSVLGLGSRELFWG